MEASKIHFSASGRNIAPLQMKNVENYNTLLEKIGVHGFDEIVEAGFGMDSIQGGITTPSIITPVQFLQAFMPGYIMVVTAVQEIDEFVGITTVGNWFDEEVVFRILENTGTPVPYGDQNNVPYASWNQNFSPYTVVRFEQGLRVGKLEAARAAAAQIDDAAAKRNSSALQLNITRNAIGFYGYNSGANNTYGFLNFPGLSAYVTVAATGTGSSTLWAEKSMLAIISDLQVAIALLRAQSQGVVDPFKIDCTLALPTSVVDYINTPSDLGYSVKKWLNDNYPKIRIVNAPQLENANGGENVFYLYADKIPDMSTDGGSVFVQAVPSKFMTLGVKQESKFYEEDYANASAGVVCTRPFAAVRFQGI